jgi:hypothetical protein
VERRELARRIRHGLLPVDRPQEGSALETVRVPPFTLHDRGAACRVGPAELEDVSAVDQPRQLSVPDLSTAE